MHMHGHQRKRALTSGCTEGSGNLPHDQETARLLFESFSQKQNPVGISGARNKTKSSTFPFSWSLMFPAHQCCDECAIFLVTKPPAFLVD